jgi:hypothetical protein
VLGSSWEPLSYAEKFGSQAVFAHKKTALAIPAGLCGLLFCTLLITKTYCTSSDRDHNGSFMEMQGISLKGNLSFTNAGIAGRQRAGMSLASLKDWGSIQAALPERKG